MKKLLLLAALFVGSLTAMAEDYITGSLLVEDDLASATLHVNLTNAVDYVAFQMDIAFPDDMELSASSEGIQFSDGRNNNGTVTINSTSQTSAFQLAYNVLSDGHTIRLVAYNLGNVAIGGASGDELLTVTVEATNADDLGYGGADEWEATFSNVKFVTASDLEEIALQLKNDEGTQTVTGESNASAGDPFDLTADGLVDTDDLSDWIYYFNNVWEEPEDEDEPNDTYNVAYDFNKDGIVDTDDLAAWIYYYNNVYEAPEEEEEE